MTEPDADADLIDRLYEGGGDSELDGLRMVRGLVARVREEMPGVEPPQAVSARLLQAAERPTTAAAVEPAREGLWSRLRAWFGGVAMHPGMAAAATLVVVAGAAAIWMRQGGKAATPTVTSEQAGEDEQAAAPPDLDKLAYRDDKLEEVAPAEERREAVVVAEGDAPAVRPADTTKSPPRKTKPPAPATGGTGGDATGDAPAEGFTNKGGESAGRGAGGGPGAGAAKPTVTTKVGGKSTPTPDSVPPPAPPPPPSDDPTAPSTEDDEGQGAPSDAELARQLTTRAITAAKKRDCTSVDALGKKVKALDPDYYASDFVKQRDIAACRAVSK